MLREDQITKLWNLLSQKFNMEAQAIQNGIDPPTGREFAAVTLVKGTAAPLIAVLPRNFAGHEVRYDIADSPITVYSMGIF